MKRILVVLAAVVVTQMFAPRVGADERALVAKLQPANEAPIVFSPASGEFKAKIDDSSGETVITYELSYEGLEGNVTQAHIHAAQPGVNGGIMIWLCSNLNPPGATPPGTQPCPPPPATITGTITAANVVAVPTQGIPANSLTDPLEALRTGNAYANVHSTVSPGGELRGQIK
jgi:hypothetical protein